MGPFGRPPHKGYPETHFGFLDEKNDRFWTFRRQPKMPFLMIFGIFVFQNPKILEILVLEPHFWSLFGPQNDPLFDPFLGPQNTTFRGQKRCQTAQKGVPKVTPKVTPF